MLFLPLPRKRALRTTSATCMSHVVECEGTVFREKVLGAAKPASYKASDPRNGAEYQKVSGPPVPPKRTNWARKDRRCGGRPLPSRSTISYSHHASLGSPLRRKGEFAAAPESHVGSR